MSSFVDYMKKSWPLIFILLLLLFVVLLGVSPKDILIAISGLRAWQIVVILSIVLLISFFLIISRKYLLFAMGVPARLSSLIYVHFCSMAAHHSTPVKLGFPTAVYLMKRLDGVPYSIGSAIIVVELIISVLLTGLIGLIGSYKLLEDYKGIFVLGLVGIIGMVLAFLFAMVLIDKRASGGWFRDLLASVRTAFSSLSLGFFIQYTCLRFGIQILEGLYFMFIAVFLGASITLWQAVTITSSAFFLGALSMVPLGLGVREASVLVYFHHLGIPAEIGLSVVTVSRVVSTGFGFALGLTLAGVLNLRKSINNGEG